MLLEGQSHQSAGPRRSPPNFPASSRRIPEFRKRKCLSGCTGAGATVQAIWAPDLGPTGSPWLSVRGSKLGKGSQRKRDAKNDPSLSQYACTQGNGEPREGAGMTQGSRRVGSEGVRVYFSQPCL